MKIDDNIINDAFTVYDNKILKRQCREQKNKSKNKRKTRT